MYINANLDMATNLIVFKSSLFMLSMTQRESWNMDFRNARSIDLNMGGNSSFTTVKVMLSVMSL